MNLPHTAVQYAPKSFTKAAFFFFFFFAYKIKTLPDLFYAATQAVLYHEFSRGGCDRVTFIFNVFSSDTIHPHLNWNATEMVV